MHRSDLYAGKSNKIYIERNEYDSMNETIRSNKLFYVIMVSLIVITTVNVGFRWEEAYFFVYLALHLLGLLCIGGGIVVEKRSEDGINYICVLGLIILLAVQGIMKYSSISFRDLNFFINIFQ
ncbi:hypothetical protein SAMN04488156_11243 [Bacillus sp. 166amftsu]|nr:hypothetical protein SAMN04488156_11243 [Bacillus sp. 166amftsu]